METLSICNNSYNTQLQSIDCRNEFNLIELSLDGLRHIFTKPSEIKQHITYTYDVLRSVYYQTGAIKSYHKENGCSISGYKGKVYSPYFIMKTSPDLRFTESLQVTRKFLGYLEATYEIDTSHLRFMFDGIMSLYIIIPEVLFGGFSPGDDLPALHSMIKSRLSEGTFAGRFDYKIYNQTELMPAVNTKRKSSKLYSILLSYEELLYASEEKINELALSPRTGEVVYLDNSELIECTSLRELKGELSDILTQTRRFMDVIFKRLEGVIEIRPLGDNDHIDYKRKCFSDVNSAIAFAQDLNGKTNLYFGLATRKDWTSGKKENCHMLGVIYADVDFGLAGHKKEAYYKTEEEALAAIMSCRVKPTAILRSGHGFQIIWRLKEPVVITDENLFELEDLIGDVNGYLHGDPVQNLDRIFRMPNTLNVKADPPVLAEIIEVNEALEYSLLELKAWIDQDYRTDAPKAKKAPKTTRYYTKTQKVKIERRPFNDYYNVLNNCSWLQGIYERAEGDHHLLHDERFNLARLLTHFENGEEEAFRVISQCSDFRKSFTNSQLKQIACVGYNSPSCKRLCKNNRCEIVFKYGIYKPIDLADLDESYTEAQVDEN